MAGEKENIITKTSKQNWVRIFAKNILEEQKEYNFKIKIIKSKSKQIMIGIAQITPEIIDKDFFHYIKGIQNVNSVFKKKFLMYFLNKKIDKSDLIVNFRWYLSINNSSLFSDAPQNFRNSNINFKINQDEIIININMKDRTFNLLTDGENKLQLYNNIPLNKPISPSILLYDEEDSIEIEPL